MRLDLLKPPSQAALNSLSAPSHDLTAMELLLKCVFKFLHTPETNSSYPAKWEKKHLNDHLSKQISEGPYRPLAACPAVAVSRHDPFRRNRGP